VMKPTSDPHEDSVKFIKDNYYQLLANRIEFETFSARSIQITEGSDGKKYDVNVFYQDEKRQSHLDIVNGALGIEGMRVLIDKDSVRYFK
jgi:hypothetical protein